jgi:hypothetical protein
VWAKKEKLREAVGAIKNLLKMLSRVCNARIAAELDARFEGRRSDEEADKLVSVGCPEEAKERENAVVEWQREFRLLRSSDACPTAFVEAFFIAKHNEKEAAAAAAAPAAAANELRAALHALGPTPNLFAMMTPGCVDCSQLDNHAKSASFFLKT